MMTSLTFLLLLSLASISSAVKTHFVYWNSTNPAFRLDNNDQIVDVNKDNLPWEYDQLHLICPQNGEQHVIYSVSKEDFESCRVSSSRPKIVAICNKPDSFMYFTITFRSFSPTPGGMEFKAGQDYYFISTSTKRDLHRRVGGYCSTHNMRMVFRVAERQVLPESNVVEVEEARPSTAQPRVWSSRVPQDRRDYTYYYQPWHDRDTARDQQIYNNEILTALPFTGCTGRSLASVPLAIALAMLATIL